MAIRKMSPCTVRTQAPVRPEATSPASSIQMIRQPKMVPTIVALPPKMLVPPISTAAMAVEQVALALVAEIVLVLQRQHDRGDRGQCPHQREQPGSSRTPR